MNRQQKKWLDAMIRCLLIEANRYFGPGLLCPNMLMLETSEPSYLEFFEYSTYVESGDEREGIFKKTILTDGTEVLTTTTDIFDNDTGDLYRERGYTVGNRRIEIPPIPNGETEESIGLMISDPHVMALLQNLLNKNVNSLGKLRFTYTTARNFLIEKDSGT